MHSYEDYENSYGEGGYENTGKGRNHFRRYRSGKGSKRHKRNADYHEIRKMKEQAQEQEDA